MSASLKLTSRSSLFDHKFPAFYACYLLKSIKTPKSQATYVGSTPNPPRRIRQHNGELTQGAYKTRFHRPWIMTMIVHGFPSKLAALQFEWAWQHPERSRHLQISNSRVETTKTGRPKTVLTSTPRFPANTLRNRLKTKVHVVRTMLSLPPWNSWPLHVTIFHPEALQEWKAASSGIPDSELPQGFTVSVEFEGVDGKGVRPVAMKALPKRDGPIDVQDTEFTNQFLAKIPKLLNTHTSHHCAICTEPIDVVNEDPLKVAICTNTSCSSASHLLCLSSAFLAASDTDPSSSSSPSSVVVPRGGSCPSCGEYTLWGDIIRGCYRRRAHGATVIDDEEDIMTEAMDTDVDSSGSVDALSGSSDTDNDEVVAPKKRGRPPKSPKSTSLRKRSSLLSPNTTVPKVKRQAKAIAATGSIGRGKAKAVEAEEHGFFLEDDLPRSPPTKVKPKTVIPKAKTTRTKVPLAGKASRPDRVSAAPPKPRGRPPKPLARPPGSESGEEIIFTPQIMVDISDSDSSAIRA